MAVFRAVGYVLLLPFFVFIAIAVLIGIAFIIIVHMPSVLISGYQWRSKLRAQSRFKLRGARKPVFSTGTLIVDSPMLGWKTEHCWWSPDDIPGISPFPIPTNEDRERDMEQTTDKLQCDFDEWCFWNYLSPKTGTAILLKTRGGGDYARRLQQKHPHLTVVDSWSGPVVEFPVRTRWEKT